MDDIKTSGNLKANASKIVEKKKDDSRALQVPDAAAKEGDKKPAGPLVAVVHRNAFYRDGYRLLVMVALAEAAAIIFLIFSILAIIGSHEPRNRYFATTTDGRLIPLTPLDQPSLDDSALLTWSVQAVNEVMTFGFHDYRERLQVAGAKYFTVDGWGSFSRAIDDADIITRIVAQKQVVKAEAGTPILRQKGLSKSKVYAWRVDVPVRYTFSTKGEVTPNDRKVTLVIVRRPTYQNPEGVGIQQWIDGNPDPK